MQSKAFLRCLISSGYVYLVFLLAGLLLAGYIPPASPDWSLEQLSEHIQNNAIGVQLCGFFFVVCSPLYITFSVAIASYMHRAGAAFEMVAAQIGLAVLGSTTFLICGVLFVVIGFRPETMSTASFILNDFAWIVLLLPWPSFLIQNFIIGWAIIRDTRSPAPIPQWVGYLNFWVAISFIPSTLLCFFKTGPFAWNGILVFWLAATVFALWFIVMSVYLFKELKQASAPVT